MISEAPSAAPSQRGVIARHNVNVLGTGERPMVLLHGYGCNQAMWRRMAPLLEDAYRVYLFDHVGTAATGKDGWDPVAYSRLERYADDVVAVLDALDLHDAVLVGHSVSATIGALVAARRPRRVGRFVMITPSPRYINEDGYRGGFERADVDELLAAIESNYTGWAREATPAIMGRPDEPRYGEELALRFCEQDPEVGYVFAKATFLGDYRAALAEVPAPTLVLHCTDDMMVPDEVAHYVADHLPDGTFVQLAARGHCPHLSAPEETAEAIEHWLRDTSSQADE